MYRTVLVFVEVLEIHNIEHGAAADLASLSYTVCHSVMPNPMRLFLPTFYSALITAQSLMCDVVNRSLRLLMFSLWKHFINVIFLF